jgi:hypothetical protein
MSDVRPERSGARAGERRGRWAMKVLGSVAVLGLVLAGAAAGAQAGGFTDEAVLALEISSELLPPPDLESRIADDLAAIRALDPLFEKIHARPAWLPGELVIELTDEAMARYRDGTFDDLDDLNATYGPVEIRSMFLNWLHFEFPAPYNPSRLAPIYVAKDCVVYAGANGLVGDGSDISATEVGEYTFKYGWGDCLAGCINNHYWRFSVADGIVGSVVDYGDALPAEQTSWSEVKRQFRPSR